MDEILASRLDKLLIALEHIRTHRPILTHKIGSRRTHLARFKWAMSCGYKPEYYNDKNLEKEIHRIEQDVVNWTREYLVARKDV